jgi:hypothetical protein
MARRHHGGMRRRLKSFLLPFALIAATVLHATPARAQQISLSLQVIGYTGSGAQQTLGRVDGVINYGGSTVSYSLTFCRQSSYSYPYMTINVNSQWIGGRKYATWITNVYPPYAGYSQSQPCYGQVGMVNSGFSYTPMNNVEYIIYGSTFIGSSFTTFSQDRIHYGTF